MTDEKLLTEVTTTHTTRSVAHEEPRPSLLSSVLAIVGFIILIVIVLWGIFHLATLASPWFSSLFSNNASSTIQVTAPASVTSGEPLTVNWKHDTKEKGMYALLYQCRDSLHLKTGTGNMSIIPCGAAFVVSPTEKTVTVTPVLSGVASTSLPLSIIFLPSATTSKQAQGSVAVIVNPSKVVAAPAIPVVAPVKKQTASPADLRVRIISASVDPSGMAVVEFDISNQGGSSTGSYTFDAYLPTQNAYTYSSPLQSPLGPGDHIVNTLRFSQTVPGSISIVVDPSSSVRESNENNNYVSQAVAMPYYQQPQYQYTY